MRWRVPARWWAVALGVPVACVAAVHVVHLQVALIGNAVVAAVAVVPRGRLGFERAVRPGA